MPVADAATAVRKLQNNQPLTDNEKILLGINVPKSKVPVVTSAEKARQDAYNAGFDVTTSERLGANQNVIKTSTGGDAALANILQSYGLEGVAGTIATIRKENPEISSEDLLALLKTDTRYNAEYLKRFAGNAELIKKGLPTIDDKNYLRAEKEYENIFKSYDVSGLANRDMYAKLIGNSMDAVDVTSRLQLGYDRLKADPNAEAAFRKFYPTLSNGDIVAAMLNPEEMLPVLQRKTAAAEIGGSALAQKLETSLASAESLAAFGVNKSAAQAGYRTIAQTLPRAQFLAEISPEENIKYTQGLAEDITFRKNVEAEKKQAALVNKEISRFSGQSGIAGSKSLASQSRGAGLI